MSLLPIKHDLWVKGFCEDFSKITLFLDKFRIDLLTVIFYLPMDKTSNDELL
jgi:hypothetical protein